jgi:hypothetical protein
MTPIKQIFADFSWFSVILGQPAIDIVFVLDFVGVGCHFEGPESIHHDRQFVGALFADGTFVGSGMGAVRDAVGVDG